MKEPLAWPNSSLSSMLSGRAPAFTGTKGPLARALWAWTARATSSLPTPVSPTISTGASERAATSIWAYTSCMSRLRPIMPKLPSSAGESMVSRRRRSLASLARRLDSSALVT